MNIKFKFFPFCIFLLFTGCKVGPNYHTPENRVSPDWVAENIVEEVELSINPPETLWWQVFNDELLNSYIEMAAHHNLDVLIAETNIQKARATRDVSMAPLFPQIGADFNAFHVFLSKNGPIDIFASGENPNIKAPTKLNIFNGFIDASWEIDLFGKTRRSVESSNAAFESTIEQKNQALISVFAEITRNYIELRSLQKEKILLEKNVKLLEKNVDILENRYSKGYSNLLDLEQINIQLTNALSLLPKVTTGIYQNIFAISVLTGNLPESLLCQLLPFVDLLNLPESLSIGLRSDLLRRRPDIKVAERNLAENVANIGVAVANFYPSLSLLGIFGLDSLKLANLFTPSSKTWIFGADFNLPIFQGGKLIGNLKISEQEAKAAAFTYQETILNALKETETILISYDQNLKTKDELQRIVDKNKHLSFLNSERYTKGLTSQIDFLNSELILNNALLSLLQSETSALLDLVSLYKALGGGWEPF